MLRVLQVSCNLSNPALRFERLYDYTRRESLRLDVALFARLVGLCCLLLGSIPFNLLLAAIDILLDQSHLFLIVFTILHQIIQFFLLREHSHVLIYSDFIGKHLEVERLFYLRYVCKEPLVLVFALLLLTADPPHMIDADVFALHKEDVLPKVFDKRV